MEQTRSALRNFLASLGPLDETALLTFSRHAHLVSDFTHDFASLTSNLVPERAAGDKAPAADERAMNDALWEGLLMVRGGHNPRKALVVMTGATDYDSRPTSELMNAVRYSDVQVYGVAIHYQPFSLKRFGNGVLQGLAEASGGLSFEVRSPKHLPEMVQKIAGATCSLYRIGFSPSSVNEGRRGDRFQCGVSLKWDFHSNAE